MSGAGRDCTRWSLRLALSLSLSSVVFAGSALASPADEGSTREAARSAKDSRGPHDRRGPLPGGEGVEAPRKVALLVGIDAYDEGDPAGKYRWTRLQGARRDVETLSAELERRGFEVKKLLDRDATGAAIEQAFREHLLAKATRQQDVALFHFSGHGQQVTDDNGDEADGYDESLVPFDNLGTRDGGKNLRDDTLGAWLAALGKQTQHVLVVLDSCHSGSGTRSAIGQALPKRGGPPAGKPAKTRRSERDDAESLVGPSEASAGVVLFSAARSNQLAQEYRATTGAQGAFTWFFARALAQAQPGATYADVFEAAATGVTAHVKDQEPVIEGDANRGVFGEPVGRARVRSFRAALDTDGSVTVFAGSLHGLGRGALFALRRPGANGQGKPVAQAELVEVELARSRAKLFAEPGLELGRELADGAEAVELHDGSLLRVAFADPASKLIEAAAGWRSVTLVPEGAQADVVVREDRRKGTVALFAAKERVPIPTLDGAPQLAEARRDDPLLPARLGQALEALRWRRRVLGIGADPGQAALKVALVAERVEAVVEDCPENARLVSVGGATEALKREGNRVRFCEVIRLAVRNQSDTRAWFTVFSLAADGSGSVLYPQCGAGERDNWVDPGATRALERVLLMSAPAGRESLKLIATSAPVDLCAVQFAVRDVSAGARGEAGADIAAALAGRGVDDDEEDEPLRVGADQLSWDLTAN